MIWSRLLLGCLLCLPSSLSIEPITITAGLTAGIAVTAGLLKCAFYECCNEGIERIIAKNSIKYDLGKNLTSDFQSKLHGQHIAKEKVAKAVIAHLKDPEPRKALVFSFHGWTGGGKNFVSYLIARNLYAKGMKSAFVHVISGPARFPDPSKGTEYKLELIDYIETAIGRCGRQLFIIDEVDKVPSEVIEGLSPFLDYSQDPKEQSKAIYIFLSNIGGGEIARFTHDLYLKGLRREDIRLQDIEPVIDLFAFNEQGGLRKTSIIEKNLIDFFIPFLPLEKKHVMLCIVDYLKEKHNITKSVNDKFVAKIANELDYFPSDTKIYSTSGCKKVARKVDLEID